MVNSETDREDTLETVKDSALALGTGLRGVVDLIGDPDETSAEDAARAVRMLIEAVRDADEIGTLIAMLEQVTEFDELG